MGLDDPLDNGEPEPTAAATGAPARRVGPVEALKDVRQVFGVCRWFLSPVAKTTPHFSLLQLPCFFLNTKPKMEEKNVGTPLLLAFLGGLR